uniref:Uncharacterized protein n=1 Tax=Utricularia reniformis TaxID=192314 RepID=A0A1Y0AZD3_9LAMI|nr:hypothetical protein AEK19_MT0213 [Utricularia reniformis]ART30491.1 hypothetical protein AEK19_MT0213 [Utricularia reniformis]
MTEFKIRFSENHPPDVNAINIAPSLLLCSLLVLTFTLLCWAGYHVSFPKAAAPHRNS